MSRGTEENDLATANRSRRAPRTPLTLAVTPATRPGAVGKPEERPSLKVLGGRRESEDVKALAVSMTTAILESIAGARPAQQLSRWMPREILAAVQLRTALARAATPAPRALVLHQAIRVRTVRLCHVAPGAYEVAIVVAERARCRAVALRLERDRRGWRITALEVG